MNSAITNGQTMIRRFLCDFHPVTMSPFMRELEPRPREEVMKYAIPADHFPSPACSILSITSTPTAKSIPREAQETVAVKSQPDVPVAMAVKSAYVPPHLRASAAGGGGSAVPEHHVAKAPEPAPAAPAGYVPPHLRRKTAGAEPMTITKMASSTAGGKKTDEFPALGGVGVAKPKKSMWSKETSFATIAAAPAPIDEEPEVETQATVLMRENERLRQMMIVQTRQREIAKHDAMVARANSGDENDEGYGDEDAYDEYGGRGDGSDAEDAYDNEDADNDKYYA